MATALIHSEFHPHKRFLPELRSGVPLVVVPGLGNSDEHHWQSLWQRQLPQTQRISLANWEQPNLELWKAGIRAVLAQQQQPVVLIAHSFGALASASIAAEVPGKIAALLLVAPADPDKFQLAEYLPQRPLDVPVTLIGSSNDPWLSADRAAYWAQHWGAEFLHLNNVGHINSASGLGLWREGLEQLRALLARSNTGAQSLSPSL